MAVDVPHAIPALGQSLKHRVDLRVINGARAAVFDQILLADIGDIAAVIIFGQQVIIGLILGWADRLWNGVIPFITIVEYGVDIKDYAAKIEHAVAHDIARRKIGLADQWGGIPVAAILNMCRFMWHRLAYL